MWSRLYDPADPVASLRLLGAGAAVWTTSAQRLAADESVRYLQARYAAGAGIPLADVEAFTIPDGLVGWAAAGTSVATMTDRAPILYVTRLSAGWAQELAAASALAWLNRVAASEPLRVANQVTMTVAVRDDRYTGRYHRVTRPGACAFCQLIRDRGYLAAKAGFQAHANCSCVSEPEPAYHLSDRARRRRR